MIPSIDIEELRDKVKTMYQQVAEDPKAEFHFEMGRALAERLGYLPTDLDRIPVEAVESFAGVGYYFDLAAIREGQQVLDLGSGSGMDSFLAARKAGPSGHVIGIDMTEQQLQKAEQLRRASGFNNLSFVQGYMEELPFESQRFDVVISNGVINLAADKATVFQEIARVLKPGGRMAIADIVTERQLTEKIVCDTDLWAACIGGAAQQDSYRKLIEAADLEVASTKENSQYRFLSKSAQNASEKFGVKSVSLAATKVR